MSFLLHWRKTQPAAGTATVAGTLPSNVAASNEDPLPVLLKSTVAGAATDVGTANPLPAAGTTVVITSAPAVTVAAYATGNAVGGKMALAAIMAVAGGSALLHEIHLLDRSNTKPAGDLLIFNADPAAATLTDKTAFVYSTDDLKQVARIPIAASDWKTINTKATADLPNVGRLIKSAATTGLWMAFVLDGTSNPTFAATTDLQIITKWIPQAN